MALSEELSALRGSGAEQALLLIRSATETATINTLRKWLGEETGQSAYFRLRTDGYIHANASLAAEARLTVKGERLADYIRGRQAPGGPDYNDAVRRELLRWVSTERRGSCSDFEGQTEASLAGRSFSADEITHAAEFLQQHQLMKVLSSWQDPNLRPEATDRGRELLVETDLTLQDLVTGPTGGHRGAETSHTYSGAGQVIVQGDHNTTLITQNINDPRAFTATLAELELHPAVSQNQDLAAAVQEIHDAAASPGASPDGIRAKLTGAYAAAVGTVLGTAGGHQVLELLNRLQQSI